MYEQLELFSASELCACVYATVSKILKNSCNHRNVNSLVANVLSLVDSIADDIHSRISSYTRKYKLCHSNY